MGYNSNVICMSNLLNLLNEYIDTFLTNIGILGPIIGSLLIVVESILPILPLFVFITLNFLKFGVIIGFIISWLCTVLGCYLSFLMFRNGIQTKFEEHLRCKSGVDKFMNVVDKLKFEHLVSLLAIPFTPAFAINIAAGLSKIDKAKYFYALLIGKVFLVFFWGYVGTSLVDSITHPLALVKIFVIILVAYIVSKLFNKKFNM